MGAGGDHREGLVPALHNAVGGGMIVLANCTVRERERESCKAMILLFIMWHVLMLEKSGANCLGVVFLSAPFCSFSVGDQHTS